MAFEAKIFVDLFGEMMRKVQADLSDRFDSIEKPYFHYGHSLELINDMLEKDKYAVDKFPIVYLLQDFTENHAVNNSSVQYTADVQLYIINLTDPNYYIADRYQHVFRTVLYPIYNSLIKNLKQYRYFSFPIDKVPHSKTDLPYWGENNANFANDYIDAIHISNLSVPVAKTNC